jgi:cytochrome c oxidase assembly protein subunit 15
LLARNLLLLLTVVAIFSLIVVGAYVTAGGYGAACGTDLGRDWPLCNGNLLPPPQTGPVVEYTHRVLASLSALFLFMTTFLFWRAKEPQGAARRFLYLASALIIIEILLGGAVVTQQGLEALLVTAHQATALLIFGLTTAASAAAFARR